MEISCTWLGHCLVNLLRRFVKICGRQTMSKRRRDSDDDSDERKKKKKKKAKKEHKKEHKHKKSKKSKRHPRDDDDSVDHPIVPMPRADNAQSSNAQSSNAQSSHAQSSNALEDERAARRAAMAPMRPEEARMRHEEALANVREEFDASTGRMRLVRGTGEIIERIVSKTEQTAIRDRATRWVYPT